VIAPYSSRNVFGRSPSETHLDTGTVSFIPSNRTTVEVFSDGPDAAYTIFLVIAGFTLDENIVAAPFDQIFYVGIPIGIGIAIFRYRLYEMDRLISRVSSGSRP